MAQSKPVRSIAETLPWYSELDPREQKAILLSQCYVREFGAFGAPDHLYMSVITKLVDIATEKTLAVAAVTQEKEHWARRFSAAEQARAVAAAVWETASARMAELSARVGQLESALRKAERESAELSMRLDQYEIS